MPITCLFTADTIMLSNFIYFISHIQFSPIILTVSIMVFFFLTQIQSRITFCILLLFSHFALLNAK